MYEAALEKKQKENLSLKSLEDFIFHSHFTKASQTSRKLFKLFKL